MAVNLCPGGDHPERALVVVDLSRVFSSTVGDYQEFRARRGG
jgi:hypothetical protein